MKLTIEKRDYIISDCVDATFKKREAALLKARTTFADALYAHVFVNIEKLAAKLPANWIQLTKEIFITCDGYSKCRWPNKGEGNATFDLSKNQACPHRYLGNEFVIDPEHKFFNPAQKLLVEFNSINKGKEELRESLRGLLYSVNTLAQLKEAWPEGAQYFPVEEVKTTAVINYDAAKKVNSIMGLPK